MTKARQPPGTSGANSKNEKELKSRVDTAQLYLCETVEPLPSKHTPRKKDRKIESNPVTRNCLETTRKKAIEAMCAHCMGVTSSLQGNGFRNHLEPGFRELIRNCTAPHCPIFPWRPFQQKSGRSKGQLVGDAGNENRPQRSSNS